jgi:hypothetical protein
MRKTALLALLCLAVVSCAVSKVEPLSVPLAYKADTKDFGRLGSLSCNAISQVQANDARTDKTLGIRTHESKPLRADVTAANDPASWVQEGVQGLLTQNGVTLQGRGPVLMVSLDGLRTTESIWHRSSYEAHVALLGELMSPSGRPCWRGTGQGSGGDYGYSGSIPDYQETLNAALDAATVQMTQTQAFKDGLCQCVD